MENIFPVTYWVFISAIIVLVFISRAIYNWMDWRIKRDAYAHLRLIQDIRDNGHRIPESPSKAATSGVYGYPYLIHWILSFIPRGYVKRLDKYFSSISDVLFSLVIISLVPLGVLTPDQTALSLILFLTTPEFVRPDVSHGTGMSGRKPGLILTTLSLLCFSLWITTGWIGYAVLSPIFGGFVFLASKFGLQAYFFISVGLAIFVSPVSLLLFAISFVFAMVVSTGTYLRVLKGHLRHLYDYAVSKQFKVSYTKPDINIPTLSEINSTKDLLEMTYKNKVLFPLFNYPVMIAFVVGYLLLSSSEAGMGMSQVYFAWTLSAMGALVLTSLPYLRFLGQAERYPEYAFLPAAIYVSVAWTRLGTTYESILALMIIFGAVTILVYYWAYQSIFTGDKKEEIALEGVIDFLNDKQTSTLVVQPIWKARHISWETGHKIVDLILNGASTPESVEELNRLFPEDYGLVTSDLDWISQRYNPEWIVFDISKMDEYGDENLKPPSVNPDYENEIYEIYRFSKLID